MNSTRNRRGYIGIDYSLVDRRILSVFDENDNKIVAAVFSYTGIKGESDEHLFNKNGVCIKCSLNKDYKLNKFKFIQRYSKEAKMQISSGILMFRIKNKDLEVFLVHPGGPIYKNKDKGVWSVPKGIVKDSEETIDAAIREFQEETGITVTKVNNLIYLGDIKQKSGKRVYAWAYENDFSGKIKSNTLDHPTFGEIPEVDKGEYFDVETAKEKILPAQIDFIVKLKKKLKMNN